MLKVPTMEEVDELRHNSNTRVEVFRDYNRRYGGSELRYDIDTIAILREEAQKAECLVLQALAVRWDQPPCPFRCGGIMIPTPTQGRLSCDKCAAIALAGRVK